MTVPPFVWTTVAVDTFDRRDSAITINPASDGGMYVVKAGTAGIVGNKGYFLPDINGGVVWREAWGTIQDVSIDHYRTSTYGSSQLILNWDRSSTTGGTAFSLDFNSSASATISRVGTEPVTLTPWTGGSTRLRMVSYFDTTDLRAHVLIFQDGVQVHEFIEPGSIQHTGVGFSSSTAYFSHFDETWDNLLVCTGRRTSGPQTVVAGGAESSLRFHPRPTGGFR